MRGHLQAEEAQLGGGAEALGHGPQRVLLLPLRGGKFKKCFLIREKALILPNFLSNG